MASSLRLRLQMWYAGILLVVLAANAWLLYYRAQQSQLGEVDADLISALRFLEGSLRVIPGQELEGTGPYKAFPRKGPPYKDKKDKDKQDKGWRFSKGGSPPLSRLLEQLRLPPDLEQPRRNGEPLYFAIWRGNGDLLKSSSDLPSGPSVRRWQSEPVIEKRGPFREALCVGPHGVHLLVGRPVDRELAELNAYAWQLLGVGLIVLAAGLAGGWFISARLFRPIATITATASAISAANLSQRIDTQHIDQELAELALVLNATFDRLESAFAQQSRFTADASHELRTPLAILRTEAELTLSRPRSAEEYRQTIEICLRAAERMSSLVEGLLTLARVDAGRLDLQSRPLDLAVIVHDCVRLLRPLAQNHQLQLEMECLPTPVLGDSDRLTQVITNLLTNAIHYNRPGGRVWIRLHHAQGTAQLDVSDTGCGIPEEDQAHLFERFYRVDRARSRASGGHGLGLAICKSIVEGHGGAIQLKSRSGEGSTFTVLLPLAQAGEGR